MNTALDIIETAREMGATSFQVTCGNYDGEGNENVENEAQSNRSIEMALALRTSTLRIFKGLHQKANVTLTPAGVIAEFTPTEWGEGLINRHRALCRQRLQASRSVRDGR